MGGHQVTGGAVYCCAAGDGTRCLGAGDIFGAPAGGHQEYYNCRDEGADWLYFVHGVCVVFFCYMNKDSYKSGV